MIVIRPPRPGERKAPPLLIKPPRKGPPIVIRPPAKVAP